MVRRRRREKGFGRQGKGAFPSRRCFCSLLVAWWPVPGARGQLGTGFCLDNIPAALVGTGFTAPSQFTLEQDCLDAGHQWCPLSNETDAWNYTPSPDTWEIQEYYWFSSCCSGKQGSSLIADTATGLPTCDSTKSPYKCTRSDWHSKLMEDLIVNNYNAEVPPSGGVAGPFRAPMLNMTMDSPGLPCLCTADSEACMVKSTNGQTCWVCISRTPCSMDHVKLGINFFKLHQIDLKSTHLSFKAWIRLDWNDYRLAYDRQCYGGVDYFTVQGDAGELENSRIWTPDLDLYNSEEPIWQGSLSSRLAIVYPCSSQGRPTQHRQCGNIFWSRPGLLKALCKYEGLSMFPLDELSCKIELAAWTVDGRYQDIITLGNGVTWTEMEQSIRTGAADATDSFAGITAGSNYQDYTIMSIRCVRLVSNYGGWPYPTLIYHIDFSRATLYYVFRLVVPAVSLAIFSFITFWMNPEIGERLGFGITVILAMVANEVVASDMMPIASERVLMDYLSMGCQFFGWFSLFETGVVLFLHHNLADNWPDCLFPKFVLHTARFCGEWVRRRSFQGAVVHQRRRTLWMSSSSGADEFEGEVNRIAGELAESKDRMLRKQLYRQIFYTVDKDFSGSLSLQEIEEFGSFMMGSRWDHEKAWRFIRKLDQNKDGVLKLDEFAIFCEAYVHDEMDTRYITKMVDGFLQVLERKRMIRIRMWQQRAKYIDQFCRFCVPFGFFIFLIVLFASSEAGIRDMDHSTAGQAWIMSLGFLPAMVVLAVTLLISTVWPTTQKVIVGLVDYFVAQDDLSSTSAGSKQSLSNMPDIFAARPAGQTFPADLEKAANKMDGAKNAQPMCSVLPTESPGTGCRDLPASASSGCALGSNHCDALNPDGSSADGGVAVPTEVDQESCQHRTDVDPSFVLPHFVTADRADTVEPIDLDAGVQPVVVAEPSIDDLQEDMLINTSSQRMCQTDTEAEAEMQSAGETSDSSG